MQRPFIWAALFVISPLVLLGCRREESVRQYRAPSDENLLAEGEEFLASVPSNLTDEEGTAPNEEGVTTGDGNRNPEPGLASENSDRMLAALINTPTRVWSFKLTGPADRVAELTYGFRSLIQSLKFIDDPQNPADKIPSWTLPKGWEERPGSQLRFASILPDPQNESLSLSVIGLPSPQDTLANVNRWRGQLQQPPIEANALGENSEKIQVGDFEGILIDVLGTVVPGGIMGPLSMQRSPEGGPRGPGEANPNLGPRGAEGSFSGNRPELSVTAPDSWQSLDLQMFQTHRWEIKRDQETAECTISRLNVAGADLLANINRWRSQIGLEAVEENALKDLVSEIELDGAPAKLVVLKPAEGTPSTPGIVAVVAIRGENAWFIKFRGPQGILESARAEFDALCTSIDFLD